LASTNPSCTRTADEHRGIAIPGTSGQASSTDGPRSSCYLSVNEYLNAGCSFTQAARSDDAEREGSQPRRFDNRLEFAPDPVRRHRSLLLL